MQRRSGPLSQLRRGHEELVLGLLRRHGPLSRGALGTRSGLSRTTLHDILGALQASGAVVTVAQDGTAPRGRGRPAETLTLNPDAGQAIGIDFARRAVHVAIVNVAHEVVGSASEPHGADLALADRVELAERLVGSLVEGTLRLGALSAVGVGIVGPVADSGADREDLPRLLRKRFGVPVLLDNNTRLAALAESIWGAAAGGQDVLYLRLSHGVGGGLVVGGALHRGAHGLSGEFGHITVDENGARCGCGGTGCLETVASVRAVLDAHRTAGGHAEDVAGLVAALEAGEPAARDVLRSVGTRVGAVLAALCNAVGPGVIVVGGELAETGPALLGPIEAALSAHILPISRHKVSLRRATLGDVGGALGGIALVLHESPLLSHYPAEPEPGEESP
ncbi:ROK family transcriptional regulator [Actinophytocola gossypii]|uniref:ROK family protein n=1 Tax=Actinophytocola gossypii TaxID=2812003 RepID=A0ABT2J131_9PSEU|nr:ROK family transcriptional regulator [Actinophytocola gossypii]MCT2581570.1 ROK family protein [Actinophytocola gossypii]